MPSAARFQCGHRHMGMQSRSATSLVKDAVVGRHGVGLAPSLLSS